MGWFKRFLPLVFGSLSVLPSCHAGVIAGRRVYSPQARTYQQIWNIDIRTGRGVPLTSSERRHVQPFCSPGGTRIWFLSGAFGDQANTQLWWFDPRTKTEKLATEFAGSIGRLLGGTDGRVFFTAYEADTPALYRWDGRLARLSPLAPSSSSPAALSPDAASLAVQSADGAPVTMMEPGGAQGSKFKDCTDPVWSADARKLACTSGNVIRILNLATGVETARVAFTQRTTSPSVADFSPDGSSLLVKTIGANHNSTYPQSDFWLLELAGARWTFIGPGQSALVVPGGVLLVTPRELGYVGKGRDWISQLLLVDPKTHAQRPLDAGNAATVEPARCGAITTPEPSPKPRKISKR